MSLLRACRLFGISRQAVYKRQAYAKARSEELSHVKQLVVDQRLHMPRLGTRKLYFLLKAKIADKGIKLGRDALFGYLRSEHLLVKRMKSYRKTTWSKHWLHKYPNLVKNMEVNDTEQLWVADITYIDTREKTAYLSMVTDAYSRKIVGHHLHGSLHTDGVAKALTMALRTRRKSGKLIHHSDRGLQYCSAQYQDIQLRAGITCSMTDGYDCYQNALAERINGILKDEFIITVPKDMEQAERVIKQSIDTYNKRRPHLSLKYKTPEQIHKEKALTFVD